MADQGVLDPPTHVLGMAAELVLEVDVGVTSVEAIKRWGSGDLLHFPCLDGQAIRLLVRRHLVAEGQVVSSGRDRLELRLTRVV